MVPVTIFDTSTMKIAGMVTGTICGIFIVQIKRMVPDTILFIAPVQGASAFVS